jgi:hypothetical protein
MIVVCLQGERHNQQQDRCRMTNGAMSWRGDTRQCPPHARVLLLAFLLMSPVTHATPTTLKNPWLEATLTANGSLSQLIALRGLSGPQTYAIDRDTWSIQVSTGTGVAQQGPSLVLNSSVCQQKGLGQSGLAGAALFSFDCPIAWPGREGMIRGFPSPPIFRSM